MALFFGSDLENLEILHVSHAVDHFLPLLGTRDSDASRTVESTFGLLPCDCDLAPERSTGAGHSLDPTVNFTATSFLVRSTATGFSVFDEMVEGRSRVRACSVLASIMQVRLKYKSLR